MAEKLSISFKNTKKEKAVYDYFYKLEDRSGEMKKILRNWYESNIEKQEEEITKGSKVDVKQNLDIDITNF
ncbi:hypothetical protein H7E67_10480 [Clostridium gasigenes]|uniref:hypothetical protein n=1 Tax=Clostridium gasigenes TaxID=94869 RepID=UPI001624E331|nr:hypothetical protein [Clostridium gasigenes]MBB6623853.1 hypothetical protein [Clostridium gasigenes]